MQQVKAQQIVRDLFEQHGLEESVQFKLLRGLSEEGVFASDGFEGGEEVRSQVVRDRVTRRFRRVSRRLCQETEEEFDVRVNEALLSELSDVADSVERDVEDLLIRLGTKPEVVAPRIGIAVANQLSKRISLGVLAMPHDEDSVRLFSLGGVLSFLEFVETALISAVSDRLGFSEIWRDGQEVDEVVGLEEVWETVRSFLGVGGLEASDEDMNRFWPLVSQGSEDLRKLGAAHALQYGLVEFWQAYVPTGYPGYRWPESAFMKADPVEERYGWSYTVSLARADAKLAMRLLAGVAMDNVQTPPVAVGYPKSLGSSEGPHGYRLQVNDPWLSKTTVRQVIERLQSAVQEGTRVPNLSEEEQELLDLVEEVEREWREEGRWPEDISRRPRGFWLEVNERWNERNPDDHCDVHALRVRYYRAEDR